MWVRRMLNNHGLVSLLSADGSTTMLGVIHGHEREPSQCLDKALFLGEGGGRGRGSLLLDKMLATL